MERPNAIPNYFDKIKTLPNGTPLNDPECAKKCETPDKFLLQSLAAQLGDENGRDNSREVLDSLFKEESDLLKRITLTGRSGSEKMSTEKRFIVKAVFEERIHTRCACNTFSQRN